MRNGFRSMAPILVLAASLSAGAFCRAAARAKPVQPPGEIMAAVEQFRAALGANNVPGFKELLSGGLMVIRNFVTGGNGTRGADLRFYHPAGNFTSSLSIPVKGEESITFKDLFPQTIQKKSASFHSIKVADPILNIKDGEQGRLDPPTWQIIEICQRIRSREYPNDPSPLLIIQSDRQFILTESELIIDLPVGTWACFSKVNGRYCLKAVFDFR